MGHFNGHHDRQGQDTLLNCDYKILTKAFVKKFCPVMKDIIQLCSVEDKNILHGVMSIISSIDYVNLHKIPAYLVSFDMFKAYDRVMLDYLVKVMKAIGFPDKFIRWVLNQSMRIGEIRGETEMTFLCDLRAGNGTGYD